MTREELLTILDKDSPQIVIDLVVAEFDRLNAEIERLSSSVNTHQVRVRYWRKDSWPYSIDEKPKNGIPDEVFVDYSEIYMKNGIEYYDMVCGQGTIVRLKVTS